MDTKKILVLGAGVSGLTTGIWLLKNGYNVTIWAKDISPNTNSNKAAAVWYPYLCYPRDKAIPWAKTTFEYLQKECVGKANTGCIKRIVTEMFDKPQPEPWWSAAFSGKITRPTEEALPHGYVDAYRIESIVIDTSVYMEYLMESFRISGGVLVQKEITDISEAFHDSKLVINCTGLGSKQLFNDDKVYPVRGQMVKIKATGYDQVVVDDDGPNCLTLVVPRVSDIMVGGTIQENNWNTDIDPADTQEILRKVPLIAPELTNIEVISEQVGLRPARDSVRLEAERFGEGNVVIHNYGHGGSGFTLSWGCAQDVRTIVDQL